MKKKQNKKYQSQNPNGTVMRLDSYFCGVTCKDLLFQIKFWRSDC